MTDKVLTANRLSDGIAVWLDATDRWNERLQDALVARLSLIHISEPTRPY